MPITARTVRLLMPVAALLLLGLALLIRAVDDGALRQYSGSAVRVDGLDHGVVLASITPAFSPAEVIRGAAGGQPCCAAGLLTGP